MEDTLGGKLYNHPLVVKGIELDFHTTEQEERQKHREKGTL